MTCSLNPGTASGFAALAFITFLVVLIVLPAIDRIAGAAAAPLG